MLEYKKTTHEEYCRIQGGHSKKMKLLTGNHNSQLTLDIAETDKYESIPKLWQDTIKNCKRWTVWGGNNYCEFNVDFKIDSQEKLSDLWAIAKQQNNFIKGKYPCLI